MEGDDCGVVGDTGGVVDALDRAGLVLVQFIAYSLAIRSQCTGPGWSTPWASMPKRSASWWSALCWPSGSCWCSCC